MSKLNFLIFLILFVGCAHVPSDDIVVHFNTDYGKMFLEIQKGALDENAHGIQWWTKKEWLEMVKEKLDADKTSTGTNL